MREQRESRDDDEPTNAKRKRKDESHAIADRAKTQKREFSASSTDEQSKQHDGQDGYRRNKFATRDRRTDRAGKRKNERSKRTERFRHTSTNSGTPHVVTPDGLVSEQKKNKKEMEKIIVELSPRSLKCHLRFEIYPEHSRTCYKG